MKNDIIDALGYLPQHRKRAGKRAEHINLDQLIDERRLQSELSGSSYDFFMMAYRYRNHALVEIKKFLGGKNVKPPELEDLFVLGFAALMTRDNTPSAVITNELVECAKTHYGKFAGGITNAFLRSILRDRESIAERISNDPIAALSPELQKRWKSASDTQVIAGSFLLRRPEPGIGGFSQELTFEKHSLEDWQSKKAFQAMDKGSWDLCEWIIEQFKSTHDASNKEIHLLDACAAPGGKFIAINQMLKKHGNIVSTATDAKYPRLERLKENISNWGDIDCNCLLKIWGEKDIPNETNPEAEAITKPDSEFDFKSLQWDLILADLPCSGSGTTHTRPDILSKQLGYDIKSLAPLQKDILEELLSLNSKNICVSICSVDPQEIGNITAILGKAPDFNSWKSLKTEDLPHTAPREGIVAWWVNKSK